MMKHLREEKKQNSSKSNKIRRASFVNVEPQQTNKFKYLLNYLGVGKTSEKLMSLKRIANSIWQNQSLFVRKVDWVKVKGDSSIWVIEAFIEGLTANFATHYLFGVKFGLLMIFAHGIVIKQGLNIFWRLKQNGPISTIPQQNK